MIRHLSEKLIEVADPSAPRKQFVYPDRVWCLRPVCNDPRCNRYHGEDEVCAHDKPLDSGCEECREGGLPG